MHGVSGRYSASTRIFVTTADRIRAHVLAERLQQHAVEAQLGSLAKLLDADRHRIVAGYRLRPVGAEHAVPPGQIEAEIAVGLGHRHGVLPSITRRLPQ